MGLFSRDKDKKANTDQPAGNISLSNGETLTISQVIDCLGDSCPRPQLMTKKAMAQANLLRAVEHGWHPTGQPAKKGKKKKKHSKMAHLLRPGMRMKS